MGEFDPQLPTGAPQAFLPPSPPPPPLGLDTPPSEQFPAGLRVLVVDDDPICLLILDRMLRRCLYQVTTCGRATTALSLLRENKDKFDLVISDVYMPDMDGFKLLELVGLEMDLPVIMMSANGETSAVMKGITHGACDYLLKPVRIEELRNIWQHVVRKKWRDSEQSGVHEDEKHKSLSENGDFISSENDVLEGAWKNSKKRKDVKEEEEDVDQENEDPSTAKKPRVVWSVDLHQQFVSAVNQLGIDKAVPKRILELMNVRGLTRENVASHLQKFRLYMKRISGVTHQPGGSNSPFSGGADSGFGAVGGVGLGGLGDLRALAASGQLSPQALVSTLQAGLLGRLHSSSNLGTASVDPSLLMQIAALQGVNSSSLVRPPCGQPLLSSQGNLHQVFSSGSDLKQLAQGPQQNQPFGQIGAPLDKDSAGISALQQQLAATSGFGGMGQMVGLSNNVHLASNNNALMMQMLHQQEGAQLTNGGRLNGPAGGIPGQPLLPDDIGARARPLSTVSSQNTCTTGHGVGSSSSMGQVRPGQGNPLSLAGSSSSDMLGALSRASVAENLCLHLPGTGNTSIPVSTGINVSSPLTSCGLNGDIGGTVMKGLSSTLGGVKEENVQHSAKGLESSFTFNAVNHGPVPNIVPRQGWQALSLNQEFGQTSNPALNPRFNQASSNSQGLNTGCRQEQGQFRASGFAGQSAVLSGSLGCDGSNPKPSISNAHSHCRQSTADTESKAKEGVLDLLMGSKIENALLPETFSSSDDFLNLFFKQQQQQEGLGFAEADLTADGYALDNMYVK